MAQFTWIVWTCSPKARFVSFCSVNSLTYALPWDARITEASAGYVKPKLKVSYYLSPECPQTIVDLVSPPLRELNWACSVEPQAATPPIFIWEGSRRSIDPAPTLSRGGLVNRVSGAFSITTKVGMLKAVWLGFAYYNLYTVRTLQSIILSYHLISFADIYRM